MFALLDASSGGYLASGLTLSADPSAAVTFDCVETAQRFASRGWCGGVELAVVEMSAVAA